MESRALQKLCSKKSYFQSVGMSHSVSRLFSLESIHDCKFQSIFCLTQDYGATTMGLVGNSIIQAFGRLEFEDGLRLDSIRKILCD